MDTTSSVSERLKALDAYRPASAEERAGRESSLNALYAAHRRNLYLTIGVLVCTAAALLFRPAGVGAIYVWCIAVAACVAQVVIARPRSPGREVVACEGAPLLPRERAQVMGFIQAHPEKARVIGRWLDGRGQLSKRDYAAFADLFDAAPASPTTWPELKDRLLRID